jgi:hypothetical protein
MKVTELFEGTSKSAIKKLEDAIFNNWLELSTKQIAKRVKGWPEFKDMPAAELETIVGDAHYLVHNQVDEGLTEGEVIQAKFGEPVKTGVVKMRVRKHPLGAYSPTGTFKVHEFTENQGGRKDSMFVSYKNSDGGVDGWPFDRKSPPEFITFMVGNEKVTLSQALAAWRQQQKSVKEGLMTEGAFVIKNTAGVEKRFKDANSEAAKLWKASGSKASKPSAVPTEKYSQAWWQYQEDKDKNYEKTMPWTKIDKHDLDSAALKAAFSSAGWNENNVDDWSVVGGSGNVKVKGVNCAALTLRVVYMFTKDDDIGVEGDDPVSDSEYITIARSPTDPKKYVFVRHGQLR